MSYGSRRSTKDKPAAPQGPDAPAVFVTSQSLRSGAAPSSMPQRPATQGVWRPPVSGDARSVPDAPTRVARALRDAEREVGLRDGLTQIMPVVDPASPTLPPHTHSEFMPVTELLPRLVGDGEPPEVVECQRRVAGGLRVPAERGLRDQAMAAAVRFFRGAQWWRRRNERWFDEADARLRRIDESKAEFADRWRHVDRQWDEVRARLDASVAGRAAVSLEQAYADGGTELVMDMIPQLQQMLLEHALANSEASS